MGASSVHTKAIVLKKTKLSETDLIITFFTESGMQLRAVAKGARKPSSTFASRLEICSNVDVLLAKGKNLDIVREVKTLKAFPSIRSDIEKTTFALPVLELLEKTSIKDTQLDNLYDLAINFLQEIESSSESLSLKSLCAAGLIKICSIIGFRPSLINCIVCGANTKEALKNPSVPMRFSIEEGGVVCYKCSSKVNNQIHDARILNFCNSLIYEKFSDIKYLFTNEDLCNQTILFIDKWLIFHLGIKLKSLYFYIKTAL